MTKYHLFISLFVISYFISLNSYAQEELNLLGQLTYEDNLNDVWGYTDTDGKEYALVGTQVGFSIVDVTQPEQAEEVWFLRGVNSVWRDIRTWQHYAYVTNETGGGLLIVDLSKLSELSAGEELDFVEYYADGQFNTAHNVWIDEFGFAYLSGYNNLADEIDVNKRGILIMDLNTDPMQPEIVGKYNGGYVHDVYVRNNLMYCAEIYNGILTIIDIQDKSNPIVIGSTATPHAFTHNTWLSDDGQTVFTTDEKDDAFVVAYKVSDVSDIEELDRYRSSPGVTPHNIHVLNDFLVISNYADGIRIVDANEPDFLTETAYYDTSPLSGGGTNGCWGAYPYFPSGNILASDRQEGLFIFQPNFQRAAYLTGTVADKNTGYALNGTRVTIDNQTDIAEYTNYWGEYKNGTAKAGTYSIHFFKFGYEPLTVDNVELKQGEKTVLDVEMVELPNFPLNIQVLEEGSNIPITDAIIDIRHPDITYIEKTDSTGHFNFPVFYENDYTVLVYKWGWHNYYAETLTISTNNQELTLYLKKGYQDDFVRDMGWSVASFTQKGGKWNVASTTGTYIGDTICNPDKDVDFDLGDRCMMTDSGPLEPEDGDLDRGTTTLISPAFDVSNYHNPKISFYTWVFNSREELDRAYLDVEIVKGDTSVRTHRIYMNENNFNQWEKQSFYVNDYIDLADSMHLVFNATSNTSSAVIEMGLDALLMEDIVPPFDADTIPKMTVTYSPNPFRQNTRIQLALHPGTDIQNELLVFLYDLSGREIVHARRQIDAAELNWYGTAYRVEFEYGQVLSPGMYLLKAGNEELGYELVKLLKIN